MTQAPALRFALALAQASLLPGVLLLSRALAQEAASDIIELSPFVVTGSEESDGYRAKETLAGTRLRTNIKDIGAPITELTRAFLEDLGVADINGIADFLPSTELETTQQFNFGQNSIFYAQTFRIRGLFTDDKARNYFNTLAPSDAYNISRVTQSRGANSILFGAANPAGTFNVSTEEAQLNRSRYSVQYRTDDYGTQRSVADVNQVLVKQKLAGRLILLRDDAELWNQPLHYQNQRRAYGALTFRPFEATAIRLNAESYDIERTAPSLLIPFDRVTTWAAAGRPTRVSRASTAVTNPTGVINFNGNPTLLASLGSRPLGSGSAGAFIQNGQRYAISTPSVPIGSTNTSSYSLPRDFMGGNFSNFGGDDRIDQSEGWIAEIAVEQRFFDKLYVQLAAHCEVLSRDLMMVLNDWTLGADASQTLSDGVTPNPNVGRYYVGGNYVFRNFFDHDRKHLRATVSYDLDMTRRSKWLGRHQFAGLLQHEQNRTEIIRTQLRNTTPLPGFSPSIANAQNIIYPIIYLNDDGSYDGISRDPRTFENAFSVNGVTARYWRQAAGTNEQVELNSALGALQSHWLGGRLVTTLGLRRDTQDLSDADRSLWSKDAATQEFDLPANNPRSPNAAGSGISKNTYSAGAVMHLLTERGALDYFSLTANKSTNFQPSGGSVGYQNELIGPSTGRTQDYGVKFGFLKGLLSGSVSRFESGQFGASSGGYVIKNLNPIWEELNMPGRIIEDKVADTFDIATRGIEFELSLQPVKGLTMAVFGSRNKNVISNKWPSGRRYLAENLPVLQPPSVRSIVTANGRTVGSRVDEVLTLVDFALAEEGTQSSELREWQFSLLSTYRFSRGALKGLSLGGTYKWKDRNTIGYAKKANGALDTSKPFRGSALADVGLNLAYSRNLTRRIEWKVQLNVQNLLDDADAIATGAVDSTTNPGQPVYTIYRRVQPRSWVLTNTLSF